MFRFEDWLSSLGCARHDDEPDAAFSEHGARAYVRALERGDREATFAAISADDRADCNHGAAMLGALPSEL